MTAVSGAPPAASPSKGGATCAGRWLTRLVMQCGPIPTGRPSTGDWSRESAGRKALVAIARKLLVVVWHVLSREEADRFASDEQVACAFFALAYKMGVKNLPEEPERPAVHPQPVGPAGAGPGADPHSLG